jgi:membrane protease YdiL (CAAX protease family)
MDRFVKTFRTVAGALRAWRQPLLLAVACLDIVLYLYLNRQDGRQLADFSGLFPFGGDYGAYAVRFLSSFLLFGLVPLGLAALLGLKPRDCGLRTCAGCLKSPLFWILAVGLPLTSAFGTAGTELELFYPFSKSLVADFPRAPWLLGLHGLLYLVLYYLPWEILFRGVLLFPFLPAGSIIRERNPSWKEILGDPTVVAAACWQVLPTVLVHYPSPLSETVGALPFGIIAALLVLRHRSILPALAIHFLCGLTVDTVIVLRAAALSG